MSVDLLQERFASGAWTSAWVTGQYLSRIEALDRHGPALQSVIEVNPDALQIAEARDRERRDGRVRGPLHGVPVLIKDNIDTADRMMTTAGSTALIGAPAPADAFLVTRLREAGAVILGKTNLSEWANFRSTRSTSGWSARGGQTRHPYVLDRNPCGSSSGSAVAAAANLAALTVGTETDGSIVCPASICGLVGVKPTVGLVSRAGIVPISASQDTAGPMTRTVRDAAVLLSVLAGADPRDPATQAAAGRVQADYASGLAAGGALKGSRIGVARRLAGFNDRVDALFEQALDVLKREGALLVDPAELPAVSDLGDAEFEVLLFEFKDGIAKYLAGRGAPNGLATLQDLIDVNLREKATVLRYFGQEIFLKAQERGPLSSPKYVRARRRCRSATRTLGIDVVMNRHRLDALVCPTTGPAWLTDLLNGDHYTGGGASQFPAVSGYPHVTVPMGSVARLPVGLSFFGRAWSEALLLRLAQGYEQASPQRTPPRFLPTLDLDAVTAL